MGRLFGDYIRNKREALLKKDSRFSIRKVAERIRVHHSYLSKIERGEPGTLSEQKIIALATELGEEPDLLLAMNGRVSQEIASVAVRHPEAFGKMLSSLKARCDGFNARDDSACGSMLKSVGALLECGHSPLARHDMRARVAEIATASAAVLDAESLDGDIKQLVQGVHDRAMRLLGSLDESLSLDFLDSGKSAPTPKPVDILEVAEAVRKNMTDMARRRGVELRLALDGVEVDGDGVRVAASERMCYSILSNLVRNAIEAAPEGGTVDIRLCGSDACVMEIHNQGMVPVQIQDSFFEKFVTAGKEGGVGIGTYIAKRMTEAMGGSLVMETDEQNGTLLTLTLPWTG